MKECPTTTNISDDMIIPFWCQSVILDVPSTEQPCEESCAAACLHSILCYFNSSGKDVRSVEEIWKELEPSNRTLQGVRPGTHPLAIVDWISRNGFHSSAVLEERYNNGLGLRWLYFCLSAGIPPLVCWADWGGHWCVVTGYISGGTGLPKNDTLVLMDPSLPTGTRKFVNAGKFYLMWFDGQHFDRFFSRPAIVISSRQNVDSILQQAAAIERGKLV